MTNVDASIEWSRVGRAPSSLHLYEPRKKVENRDPSADYGKNALFHPSHENYSAYL